MPRPPRPQFPGAIYHVDAKGNRGGALFVDEYDRRTFLSRLAYVVERYAWECQSFCVMTTHYHLLLTTPEGNVAAGMQYLNSRYAEYFNDRHRLAGHVLQGRYWSKLVNSDEQLLEGYRYIALNPVRAGICRRPADWPWSGYAAVAGTQSFSFLRSDKILAHFGAGTDAVRALCRFVERGI